MVVLIFNLRYYINVIAMVIGGLPTFHQIPLEELWGADGVVPPGKKVLFSCHLVINILSRDENCAISGRTPVPVQDHGKNTTRRMIIKKFHTRGKHLFNILIL